MITGLAIIIVYWIIFDSMKVWPNWKFHSVDVLPLYNLEKSLFGISEGAAVITPNEFFLKHSTTAVDIIAALFYLSWIPLPLIFAFYLYFRNRSLFLRFCAAFFIVNCIGFVIYYTHPAAPPWYRILHGSAVDVMTKSNAAGLLRFDQYFGVNLFRDIYAKGSNVFAALPSLHASYPLIGLFYAFKQRTTSFKILFAVVMVGIWFSAIYLTHHYIIDVLLGISCGVTGIFLLEKVLLKTKTFGSFMKRYEEIIT
jgi:membrane-associated phospholipid phosphatase